MSLSLVKDLYFNATPVHVASRVVLTEDVPLIPHAILRKGEQGTVTVVQEDAGGVWQIEVLMDNDHAGLAAWGNEALLAFPELTAVSVMLLNGELMRAVSVGSCMLLGSG